MSFILSSLTWPTCVLARSLANTSLDAFPGQLHLGGGFPSLGDLTHPEIGVEPTCTLDRGGEKAPQCLALTLPTSPLSCTATHQKKISESTAFLSSKCICSY